MERGYGKHQLVVDVYVDEENMIQKLMELSDRANEVSALAKTLIQDLRQGRPEEPQNRP